ncbi:MAG: MurR/RpiR family transcriptional regulator [Pikeienuella sp.]
MSPPATLADIHSRLMETMPDLPRRIAEGARYLVDHPDEVVIHSMRDLAGKAGVSAATLVRLAHGLGYENWSDLRDVHADHMRSAPRAYAEKAWALTSREAGGGLLTESLRAQLSNLTHLAVANAEAALTESARILAGARRVHVAAFMSCRGPGHTFVYLCRMLRNDVILLGGEATSIFADLAALGPEDAVLSINFHPYAREMEQVAGAVENAGAALICLSDSRATPLTRLADQTLLFPTESPSFFPSITAAHALVEALIMALLSELGDVASERIARVEQALYANGTYTGRR